MKSHWSLSLRGPRSIDAARALRPRKGMAARHVLLAVLAIASCVVVAAPHPAATGSQHDVVFTDYSTLSSHSELLRRLLSPLNALRLHRSLAQSGERLREQPIDLSQERFAVYVPSGPAPAQGYALLVFVPPWTQATVPRNFIRGLDHHRMIFVSAAHSGNDSDVLDRRIPLALLAVQNIVRRYAIDPQRIFIGGLSGGSRVALRTALAYPDVFRGALLNAGSDPIGDARIALPPADLFTRFQEETRLVYLTGGRDQINLMLDARSRRSLQDWCVFDLADASSTIPWTGHELANPAALDRALGALEKHVPIDSERRAQCRTRIDQELAAGEKQLGELVASHQDDAARALLTRIDSRFGGLAAPQSVQWMDTLRGENATSEDAAGRLESRVGSH